MMSGFRRGCSALSDNVVSTLSEQKNLKSLVSHLLVLVIGLVLGIVLVSLVLVYVYVYPKKLVS